MAIAIFCLFVLNAFSDSIDDVTCRNKLLRPLPISQGAAGLIHKRLKLIKPGDYVHFQTRRGRNDRVEAKYLGSDREKIELTGQGIYYEIAWSDIVPYSIKMIKNFKYDPKSKAIARFCDGDHSQIAFVEREPHSDRLVSHTCVTLDFVPFFDKQWHVWFKDQGDPTTIPTKNILLSSLLSVEHNRTNSLFTLQHDLLDAASQKKMVLLAIPEENEFYVEVIRPLAVTPDFLIFQQEDGTPGTYTYDDLAHANYAIFEAL